MTTSDGDDDSVAALAQQRAEEWRGKDSSALPWPHGEDVESVETLLDPATGKPMLIVRHHRPKYDTVEIPKGADLARWPKRIEGAFEGRLSIPGPPPMNRKERRKAAARARRRT